MNEKYLKARIESLQTPKHNEQIADEDLLRKICEYVEQAFLVFKKSKDKPIIHYNISKSKVPRKKKKVKPFNINEEFSQWLSNFGNNLARESGEVFKFVIDMRGFNGLPKIVSDEQSKLLEEQGNVFYRGTIDTKYHANLLADKSNYHYGSPSGIYSSPSRNHAEAYAYTDDSILKFHLVGKGILDNTLTETLRNIKNKRYDKLVQMFTQESKEVQERLNLFYVAYHNAPQHVKNVLYDSTLLATFLGYDYTYFYDIFCILNRGAIYVSQSEFDRVTKGTKYESQSSGEFEYI